MKRALAAVCGATLLIIFAHRLPAPILEEKPSPTEAPSKPKSAPAKHKSSDSPNSSSIRRFYGMWRATFSSKNKFGSTFSNTKTLITLPQGLSPGVYIGKLTDEEGKEHVMRVIAE